MPTSAATDLWDVLAREAADESSLWGEALRPVEAQDRSPVFSPLCDEVYALGVETIYEGYLLHYGRPRLFAPADEDTALLLGDYLYAHGLVRVAATGSTSAVRDLAELISLCAQSRADGTDGDAAVWAATCSVLGDDVLDAARAVVRAGGGVGALEDVSRTAADPGALGQALAAHRRYADVRDRPVG